MKDNIVLVWMPGSGKSTIWKRLSIATGKSFLDVDDYIEDVANQTVWEVLKALWDDLFLDYEAKLVQQLDVKNTVISTSGSVPLRQEAMNHLRQSWISILIDIPLVEVYARLKRMKIERIVWMGKMTLEEILEYRKMYYEISHDFRFSTDFGKAKSDIFKDFLEFYETLELVSYK